LVTGFFLRVERGHASPQGGVEAFVASSSGGVDHGSEDRGESSFVVEVNNVHLGAEELSVDRMLRASVDVELSGGVSSFDTSRRRHDEGRRSAASIGGERSLDSVVVDLELHLAPRAVTNLKRQEKQVSDTMTRRN